PLPHIYDRLKDARPLGDIKTFRKTHVSRRQFGSAEKYPGRLIPLGDAMTSFNPTFGQGMSVAALQAAALSAALKSRDALDGVAAAYFPAAEAAAGAAWAQAIATDYSYAETEGPRPADYAQTWGFSTLLRRLAQQDPEVLKMRWRVGHMLESGAVFRQS